jgi:hypothetical protein
VQLDCQSGERSNARTRGVILGKKRILFSLPQIWPNGEILPIPQVGNNFLRLKTRLAIRGCRVDIRCEAYLYDYREVSKISSQPTSAVISSSAAGDRLSITKSGVYSGLKGGRIWSAKCTLTTQRFCAAFLCGSLE